MTFKEMVDSIYCCSIGHKLNGEKNTKENFRYWFDRMFMNDQKHVLFSMEFPDGEWHCIATHAHYGYGYYVPETRAQEKRMLDWFWGARGETVNG